MQLKLLILQHNKAITLTIKAYLVPIFLGVLFSRLVQPLFFPIEISLFSIDFGHITIFMLTITATLVFLGKKTVWLWFFLASSFDQIVYLVIKIDPTLGFYSLYSYIGSIIFVILSAVLFVLISIYSNSTTGIKKEESTSFRQKLIYIVTILIVIGVSRLLQVIYLNMGIPNEERSLMIMGYEVHHINHGLILIYISSHILYFFSSNNKIIKNISLLMLVLGIALINDQISYYALKEISDEAYLSFVSFIGAVFVSIIQIILLFSLKLFNYSK